MAFKMKGMSFGNSPLHQDKTKDTKGGKAKLSQHMAMQGKRVEKGTRTDAQKAKDKKELDRQTRIQKNVQRTAAGNKRRKQNQLRELGYYQSDEGKIVHPFGKREKMDKTKWDKWKKDNPGYKGPLRD